MVKTGPKEKSKESINKRADEASLTNDPNFGVKEDSLKTHLGVKLKRFVGTTFKRRLAV